MKNKINLLLVLLLSGCSITINNHYGNNTNDPINNSKISSNLTNSSSNSTKSNSSTISSSSTKSNSSNSNSSPSNKSSSSSNNIITLKAGIETYASNGTTTFSYCPNNLGYYCFYINDIYDIYYFSITSLPSTDVLIDEFKTYGYYEACLNPHTTYIITVSSINPYYIRVINTYNLEQENHLYN